MVASKVDEINSLVESASDFVGKLLPMCAEAPPTGGKTTEDMMKGIEWLLYDASQLAGSVHALEASVRRQEEDFLASLEQPRVVDFTRRCWFLVEEVTEEVPIGLARGAGERFAVGVVESPPVLESLDLVDGAPTPRKAMNERVAERVRARFAI
jgi:hypothetical protein